MTKKNDSISKWIRSINWKYGQFNTLPLAFGILMALLDIAMMSIAKLVGTGKLSSIVGTPLAVGLYAFQPLVFIRAMDYEGMAVTNLIWNLMSDIIVTLNGVLVFGESIKGLRWLGILMSMFSLGLLAYTDSD